MSQTEIGIIGIVLVVVLILIGTHVGYTMLVVGFIGFAMIGGWSAAFGVLTVLLWDKMSSYDFSPLPLYLLMGAFVALGGIGRQAYEAARTWFGELKGGLGVATIGACGLFAAVSGSSLAGSLVMGKVAYPEMRRYGYKMPLAAGVVSVGGTLGILIPPSMAFILIGIMTNLSIGQLFISGILPGIIVVIFYMGTCIFWSKIDPTVAPSLPKTTWKEKIVSMRLTWPIIALFLLVMGGIYTGVFTPTEAGAVGAFGALVIPMAKREMTLKAFWGSLTDAAKMTAMIMIMLVGAMVFNAFLAITQIPTTISEFMTGLAINKWFIMALILVFYIIAGMFFEVYAIVILTIPIIYPAVHSLGFDLIWWSVLVVRIIEIGQISPPYGINLFGLVGVIDAPLTQIYRGVIPFLMTDVLNIILLCAVPAICTFLPYRMM